VVLEPGERHWSVLEQFLVSAQVRVALVIDAQLAALALEQGAMLYTAEGDFRRCPGVRVLDPFEEVAA